MVVAHPEYRPERAISDEESSIMIVTKKCLPRRTVLRGLGAMIGLPFLDSMVPAFAAVRNTAAKPVRRLSVVYAPMGMNMGKWTPPAEGMLQLSPILEPVAPFQDRLLVLSGLDSREAVANDASPHPRCQTSWLTGARANRTEGVDIRAGISMDQIAAEAFGNETPLASLELALEAVDTMNGGCAAGGYSCAYSSTIAWRTPTTPLPMEHNPRAVFERLFGANGTTDRHARLSQMQRDRSVLDAVTAKVARLEKELGADDRTKLAQYLDAVRDVERRIQKGEQQVGQELPVLERPAGVPASFEEHAKLMYELLVLAYQCDLTRVSTFLYAREGSLRSFPEIGVPDAWHPLSHHSNSPEKLEKLARIQTYHVKMFAHFLGKLRSTPDGDGSLLDHTLILYGSGMSNSDVHLPMDVPTMVIGGPTFQLNANRHLRYEKGTPLANLHLTLLDKVGVPVEHFGDSTGELNLLSAL
jgi:diadenosine tetraphosphatase ApaH/serine/threonine PP2A family protein phosphatase